MNMVPPDNDREQHGHTLSTCITVIVFWGLAIAGVVISVLLLQNIGQQGTAQRNAVTDRLAYRVQRTLAGTAQRAGVGTVFSRLAVPASVEGTELRLAGKVVSRSGTITAGADTLVRPLNWNGRAASLSVAFEPLADNLKARRSHLLLGLGALLLGFGFALKQVLERVLTRPVNRLVQTARKLSLGATDLRFPDARRDELGYLARFINHALDTLVAQQGELSQALNRAQHSESELFRAKELAEVTLHSIGDAVITTDRHGRVQYLNPVAEQLVGLSTDQVRGRPLADVMPLVAEHTGERLEHPMNVCLREARPVQTKVDAALVRADASTVPIVDTATPIRGTGGVIMGGVMVFHDVSHMRSLQHELAYQAGHDLLTGLYNRREFERKLKEVLEGAQRDGHCHSVCYLDLDQFKVVNDTCGHEAGDQLLRELCAHLNGVVRATDLFARLGGDEFVILLRHCPLSVARQRAEEFRTAVEDFRFHWNGSLFQVGASIGLVEINAASSSVGEVLSMADMACYAAKEGGRSRVHVHDPDDAELRRRRGEMRMVTIIREALRLQRLCLCYQPIVPVNDPNTTLGHHEILLRMRDDNGQLLSPAAFIPAAERYQLMSQLDRWVVSEALRVLRGQPEDVCFSVNISGQSLGEDGFRKFLIGQLEAHRHLATRVCFEITETAVITNFNCATRLLQSLRDIGCQLALDDFGTGLSSFGYLKNLPVDYLKIDGTFVRTLETCAVDRATVRAINDIGHELGIRTVAEFVESEAIFKTLMALGVDYAQGYWIARPRPLEELASARVPSDLGSGHG
ncbi:MAG: EAL domain-containing protein [Gammaproteobacteria bacterium]